MFSFNSTSFCLTLNAVKNNGNCFECKLIKYFMLINNSGGVIGQLMKIRTESTAKVFRFSFSTQPLSCFTELKLKVMILLQVDSKNSNRRCNCYCVAFLSCHFNGHLKKTLVALFLKFSWFYCKLSHLRG